MRENGRRSGSSPSQSYRLTSVTTLFKAWRNYRRALSQPPGCDSQGAQLHVARAYGSSGRATPFADRSAVRAPVRGSLYPVTVNLSDFDPGDEDVPIMMTVILVRIERDRSRRAASVHMDKQQQFRPKDCFWVFPLSSRRRHEYTFQARP